MSLFGSLMGDFEEDPIFGSHMHSMMNSIFNDPFGMMGPNLMARPAIADANHPALGHHDSMLPLMPFRFPTMPAMNMNGMFSEFHNGMATGGHCHSYTSSSVMTMASGPDGRPQVYQETMSLRTAPGGIKETKKTVSDSRTGTKKMAIGHHIGDRAHILEREHNVRNGDQEERQEFINLDEDEAESFNDEWKTRTTHNAVNPIPGRNYLHGSHNRNRGEHRQLALPEPPAPSPKNKRLKWSTNLKTASSTSRSEDLPSAAKKAPTTTIPTGSRKREHTSDTKVSNKRSSTIPSDST